jgi:hypothetical protein
VPLPAAWTLTCLGFPENSFPAWVRSYDNA